MWAACKWVRYIYIYMCTMHCNILRKTKRKASHKKVCCSTRAWQKRKKKKRRIFSFFFFNRNRLCGKKLSAPSFTTSDVLGRLVIVQDVIKFKLSEWAVNPGSIHFHVCSRGQSGGSKNGMRHLLIDRLFVLNTMWPVISKFIFCCKFCLQSSDLSAAPRSTQEQAGWLLPTTPPPTRLVQFPCLGYCDIQSQTGFGDIPSEGAHWQHNTVQSSVISKERSLKFLGHFKCHFWSRISPDSF